MVEKVQWTVKNGFWLLFAIKWLESMNPAKCKMWNFIRYCEIWLKFETGKTKIKTIKCLRVNFAVQSESEYFINS